MIACTSFDNVANFAGMTHEEFQSLLWLKVAAGQTLAFESVETQHQC